MEDHTQMTSRWVVRQCPYCDEHGYLPNGYLCHHEPPEVLAERAHRGANLARAQRRPLATQSRDEPYLPPGLAARHETDQPEQETA